MTVTQRVKVLAFIVSVSLCAVLFSMGWVEFIVGVGLGLSSCVLGLTIASDASRDQESPGDHASKSSAVRRYLGL